MNTSIEFGDWEEILQRRLQKDKPSRIAYVVDKKVYELHDLEFGTYPFFEIQASEEKKSVSTLEEIWKFLSDQGMDRHSALVAIGGGLTTDISGFAAATYMRGIKVIYVPTTLLGMVDASLGGKTGVNFQSYKNRLGSYTAPGLIIQDEAFLKTLAETEWLSGWAETIKHALIADPQLWTICNKMTNVDSIKENISEIIPLSMKVKEIIVDNDFQERGERKKLNFGHTLGHALESLFLQKDAHLPHGFAITAGMIIETNISRAMDLLHKDEADAIIGYLSKVYPKLEVGTSDIPQLLKFMKGDKKNKGVEIDFTLLSQIGQAQTDNRPSPQTIESSIRSYIDGL